jgi:lactoylglutathione lyase
MSLLFNLSRRAIRPTFSSVRSFSTSTERPFRILGVQQIAIGALKRDNLSRLWVDTLGLEKKGNFVSEKENVNEDICSLGNGPLAIEFDLMEPLNPDKAPKVHIPPLNHIGLWVDDLKACVQHLEAKKTRFTPGGIRKGAGGHDVIFIHPKGSPELPICGEGVLIELVQAPKDVIEALGKKN